MVATAVWTSNQNNIWKNGTVSWAKTVPSTSPFPYTLIICESCSPLPRITGIFFHPCPPFAPHSTHRTAVNKIIWWRQWRRLAANSFFPPQGRNLADCATISFLQWFLHCCAMLLLGDCCLSYKETVWLRVLEDLVFDSAAPKIFSAFWRNKVWKLYYYNTELQ